MNIESAVEMIEWWEEEGAALSPTQGSEDEPNVPAGLTVVGKYVVYSYLTQGQILSEVWSAKEVVAAVESVKKQVASTASEGFELWPNHRAELREVTL